MRIAVVTIVCLLALMGCGGSTGTHAVKVAGTTNHDGVINVYPAGHVGEADRLIATARASYGKFALWVPESGLYDLEVAVPWAAFGPDPPVEVGQYREPFPNRQITYPETNVGLLEVYPPPP